MSVNLFRYWHRASAAALAVASVTMSVVATSAQAAPAVCPFDTGGSDAINDGVVLTRYALGITGSPMTASTRYASLDPLQVKANIECVGCALDMNGDNQIDSVDATIIARHLAGFSGASVTNGLTLGAGSRNTTAAVTSFLANGCAASTTFNAFVQGGNSFGNVATPAVLGTTDGKPLIVGTGNGSGLRITILPSTGRGEISIVNGSANNMATSLGSTVAGGGYLRISCHDYESNTYNRSCGNVATDQFSTVSGGFSNIANGFASIISGGAGNSAGSDYSSVLGGNENTASGSGSTVAGGLNNVASGIGSLAAGYHAEADKDGTFVWADHSTATPFKATLNWQQPTYGANTFNVRATGGVVFATGVAANGAPTTNCFFAGTLTGWSCTSDRNVKERIEPITPSRVLAGVLAMPVSTWSIIGSKFRQMGPMAQDFYRAFGLGDTDKAINSIDASGVAFAAIQGLNARLTAQMKLKDAENAKLKARLAAIEKKLGM